jgi:predicted metal-dependent hydrolase
VSVPRGLTDLGRERAVAVAVRAWAWAGLLAEARRHAEELAARLGMPVTDVRLTRARSRWGSCSSTGVIRINVALAAAPPDLLEYLVAHEVAHLRWRGHGPRFYAALTRLLPDWQDRRARLRIFEREHPDLLRGPNGIPSPT